MSPISWLGRRLLRTLMYLGRSVGLVRAVMASLALGKLRLHLVINHIVQIGYGSQLVVVVTGAFTGAVLSAQVPLLAAVRIENAVGGLVSVAMCRELGPVLTGLMLVGRVGASMTAEIGTMKVSEQIDALRSLAIQPVDYLVAPRMVAMLFSIPLLVMESILCGILASWLIATKLYGLEPAWFWSNLNLFNGTDGLAIAAIKGLVFGQIITIIACQQGLESNDGAVGVGRATTDGVVIACLLILICNFFLSLLLNMLFRGALTI